VGAVGLIVSIVLGYCLWTLRTFRETLSIRSEVLSIWVVATVGAAVIVIVSPVIVRAMFCVMSACTCETLFASIPARVDVLQKITNRPTQTSTQHARAILPYSCEFMRFHLQTDTTTGMMWFAVYLAFLLRVWAYNTYLTYPDLCLFGSKQNDDVSDAQVESVSCC
jgi:hypothetical protein